MCEKENINDVFKSLLDMHNLMRLSSPEIFECEKSRVQSYNISMLKRSARDLISKLDDFKNSKNVADKMNSIRNFQIFISALSISDMKKIFLCEEEKTCAQNLNLLNDLTKLKEELNELLKIFETEYRKIELAQNRESILVKKLKNNALNKNDKREIEVERMSLFNDMEASFLKINDVISKSNYIDKAFMLNNDVCKEYLTLGKNNEYAKKDISISDEEIGIQGNLKTLSDAETCEKSFMLP